MNKKCYFEYIYVLGMTPIETRQQFQLWLGDIEAQIEREQEQVYKSSHRLSDNV